MPFSMAVQVGALNASRSDAAFNEHLVNVVSQGVAQGLGDSFVLYFNEIRRHFFD